MNRQIKTPNVKQIHNETHMLAVWHMKKHKSSSTYSCYCKSYIYDQNSMEINYSATLTNYLIQSPADIFHMSTRCWQSSSRKVQHTQTLWGGWGGNRLKNCATVPLCSIKISLMLTHATHHSCISLKGCICWLGSYIIDNGSTWCRRDECRMGYARGRRTNKSCCRWRKWGCICWGRWVSMWG